MALQSSSLPDDPYKQLKDRLHRRLKEQKLEDKIFEVIRDSYTMALQSENIILSRTERKRLLRDILKDELNDMLAAL